ncbi:LONGIFOLIA protein [Rhynchospora pubera]|uniref:LONGIFOLIA protein n=1 Tax=Rhynchospora pubera TaxID=906938 RepID=A0AAV8H5E2_9POAL|nr:LONGIFOLIA protein [Rhynchospora pubera]
MSAKFLHAFADDNPDLSRQIGCMTGIFQMFDRQYVPTSVKRLPAPKQLPSGPALSNTSSAERVMCSSQILLEKNLSKSWKETQRASLESSNSFSSSSSSFSSLDCNRSINHDLPPLDRILFPEMPLKNSPKLKIPDSDTSIDIRDVVKDSINRETRGSLSVKSSTKEGREQRSLNYYRDSPRPLHLPKKGTGSELDESLRVLVKLKEGSTGPTLETNQPPRLSFDAKDVFSRSLTRDAPRFSYDGREVASRSRENYDNTPRLSLDSKDPSLLDSNSDSNSNSNSNSDSTAKGEKIGIVAKLMGLEALPKSSFRDQEVIEHKDGKISTPRNYCDEKMPKIPIMQEKRRCKSPDLSMKPMSSSRIPIEPAPWKKQERICIPQKTSCRKRETQAPEQQVSVYSEIEKRLKDLEFEQSNRDLRALKQILDSMHAKGLLEAERNPIISNSNLQNEQHLKSNKKNASTRDFKSPIVIMKPTKTILGAVEDAPLAPAIPPLRTNDDGNKKKLSVYNRISVEQSIKAGPRVSPSKRPDNRRTEENIKQKTGSNSSSTSPRLQQKKLEMEKRSKPPIPNSNSNKSSKQHASRNSMDSTSPRNRLRRKPAQTEKSDEFLSDVSTDHNADEVSLRSDSTISMASSKIDVELSITEKSGEVKSNSLPQREYQIVKAKGPLDHSSAEITGTELPSATPEHPSPVSVLDASLYHEDVSPPMIRPPILSREKGSQATESQSLTESSEKEPAAKSKKMENIQNLLLKLKQLSLSEQTNSEAAGPAPDHIALLCETPDPDHRYVSEILLASGLLMKDWLEAQLHASGNPINPDLFLVLEQRKSGWVVKPEAQVKSDPQKTHRRLVFDLVNELLLQKLDSKGMMVKSINRQIPLGGQKLLREVCAEIEELKREKGSSEDESNVLSGKDMMKRSDGWAYFGRETSGIVLDVERSIFKELIDEVVTGEVAHGTKARVNRRRRQLFVK